MTFDQEPAPVQAALQVKSVCHSLAIVCTELKEYAAPLWCALHPTEKIVEREGLFALRIGAGWSGKARIVDFARQ